MRRVIQNDAALKLTDQKRFNHRVVQIEKVGRPT
jgi:hypothetical protein